MDDLTLVAGAEPRRPVLLVAYNGYFDIAMVATQATDAIATHDSSVVAATIDCDRYYDFTDQRPTVSIANGGVREVVWPDHHFRRVRVEDAPRDLLVLTAPEPHLAWARYARLVVELAQRTGVELLVTLGAVPDRVPHSRAPMVFGSTTTPGLAARLGLSKPQYQGLTGIVGVLHDAFDRAGIAAVALRAPVAHYLAGAPHPRAVLSLVGHVQHVTGVPLTHVRLDDEIDEWQRRHDEAVAENPEAAGYVRSLEADHDQRIERSIPTGDHLANQFEQFLRDKDTD